MRSAPEDCNMTSPAGFKAAGVSAGIKSKGRKDIALVFSDFPASITGVFTTNRVQAAPVLLCKKNIAAGIGRAVLVNSGYANACTGSRGASDALDMTRTAARLLHVPPRTVFVCSTGTIGVPLPMDRIRKGIALAVRQLSPDGGHDAAVAIMTTDTHPKRACKRVQIDGRSITIAGIAKGSGMISPNMATMLAIITTDAKVAPAPLRNCLACAVNESFNRITVDGDMSTNDTVLFMANGAAGGAPIRPGSASWKLFQSAVSAVAMELAMMIVRDGEGATKLVSVTVKGASDTLSAEKAARAVACSLLVKTSWYGADPNWGRIICAVGYSGARIDPDLIDIAFNDNLVVSRGRAASCADADLRAILSAREFSVTINLGLGKASRTIHTCDCSEEYVRINASYMT